MAETFRALCAELVNEFADFQWAAFEAGVGWHSDEGLIERARAALADEPAAPEGREPGAITRQTWPADDQLLATLDHATASFPPQHPDAEALNAVEYSLALELRKAHAVLARWGNPAPAPPADGEVARLVAWLKQEADDYTCLVNYEAAARCNRAAVLLQRQALVPVPVSERLPGPEDMTEDGEVWIEDPGLHYPIGDAGDYDWEPHKWILRPIGKFDAKNGLRWLPAHALPLPEVGE